MIDTSEHDTMARSLEGATPEEVLRWAVATYQPNLAFATSFGAEDMVLLDMLSRLEGSCRVFTLDTGRLPQETYDVHEKALQKYGIRIEAWAPNVEALENLITEHGPNLFYRGVELRKRCCTVRKVEPLGRALAGARAWLCGLRREQSITRQELAKVERDAAHGGIVKINPLADWSEEQVWQYIRSHDVPYNQLHDASYPSIGCAPCTRAVQPGEDIRAGRWWWESPAEKECGLHARSSH